MVDAASCTGETLSLSPSTNPTLTDDSTSCPGKHLAKESSVGGNAAMTPAASCPIDVRGTHVKSSRSSSKRPLFSSSEDEEDEARFEVRGKGKGRLTRPPTPKPYHHPRPTSRHASPSTPDRERSPKRPIEPKTPEASEDEDRLKKEALARERSPKRSASVHSERSGKKPNRPDDGRTAGPAYYNLSTPNGRSPRQASRDAVRGLEPADPSVPLPDTGKPPLSPRMAEKGVAGTPSSSSAHWTRPPASDPMKERLAEALKEIATQRHLLSLQARVQEESQTSARAAIRLELQSVELAEQRAAFQSRAEMAATLGARDDALNRSHAELEVANFRASAEINSLARARYAEQQERTEAQRLREQAEEAARVAAAARTEAETIRLLSDSRLHNTERTAEAKVAEKSANLVLEAEHAVRQRVEQCEREAREEQVKLREELAAVGLRERTQAADHELAEKHAQLKLRGAMTEFEVRERTRAIHHEHRFE